MNIEIFSVSQLNRYVKDILSSEEKLKSVYLKGEISNLTYHRSGHIYFSLKDENCAVRAVMFAGRAKKLKFNLKDGMKVIVRGNVTLYEVSGLYQINIEEIQPDGVGALNLAYEQLKKKLSKEGLFDKENKKGLPKYPKRIGVITSPTGAAIQDICRILKRRYPIGEIVMCPVTVQGENAAYELTQAVNKFNRLKCADVIIIGRGGGSIEDLWAFNDEQLARAIHRSEIPVVSAVGHEIDTTICDFVSDKEASTPSAGAELVSPETENMLLEIKRYQRKIDDLMQSKLRYERQRYERVSQSKVMCSPNELIDNRRMNLDMISAEMRLAYNERLSEEKRKFAEINAKLDTLSPLKVLSRGYAIMRKGDTVIRKATEIDVGDKVEMILLEGTLKCTVTERKMSNE